MIEIYEHQGNQIWRVDRADATKKGYAEDQPPIATYVGAVALFMVPITIISITSPYPLLNIVGVIALALLISCSLTVLRILIRAERHWQQRQVEFGELSEPSKPRGDEPASN